MDIDIEEWKPDLPISHSEILNTDDTVDIKPEVTFLQAQQQQQKCHICDKLFENLEAHYVSSHIKDEISSFNESENLFDYINVNEDVKNNSKKYINSDEITFKDPFEHINEIHKDVMIENPKNCDCCGKSFTRASSLKRHVKIVHEGIKDHECNHCGKSFSQARYLKTHVKSIHEGVKEHVCNDCGKSFSLAHHLKTHIKAIHKGMFVIIVARVFHKQKIPKNMFKLFMKA